MTTTSNITPIASQTLKRQPHTVQPENLPCMDAANWAFTTRRVDRSLVAMLLPPEEAPSAGDLILARIDALGHHGGLQLINGRRKTLFEKDLVVVAYGNRYASNQFEALIPETMGPCHLAAGGGIASRAISWHTRIAKGPTQITPLGALADAQRRRLNLRDFALASVPDIEHVGRPIIAFIGTGMDSGKTSSAAFFTRGLIAAGLKVGYAKVTGTGAGGDTWLLSDAGASPVLDFTDAGMASTYMVSPEGIESILMTLVGHLAKAEVDVSVLEIADGVLQRETAALLQSPVFNSLVHGVVMSARDAMGASFGVEWLQSRGCAPVLALSGILSAAPLQVSEATAALGLPVYNREQLADPAIAITLIGAERCSHSDSFGL